MGSVAVNDVKAPTFIAHKTGHPDYWQIYEYDHEVLVEERQGPGPLVAEKYNVAYRRYGPLEMTIYTSEARALDVVDELTEAKNPPMTIFQTIKTILRVWFEVFMIKMNGNPKIRPRNRHERRTVKHRRNQV